MAKRTSALVNTTPRDMKKISDLSGNLYKSLVILSKRANQLAKKEKEELVEKLAEFAPKNDNLEEIFDNREQMEISAHYEKLPKTTLVATDEYLDGKVYFRDPEMEEEKLDDL
jgi:hypothetical protein